MRDLTRTSNCNACVVKGCAVSSKIHKGCVMFEEDTGFKTPLLTHLLMDERKTQSAFDILNLYKIRFTEKEDYPYFKLTLQ